MIIKMKSRIVTARDRMSHTVRDENIMNSPSEWINGITPGDMGPGDLRARGVSMEALRETLSWAPRIMSPTAADADRPLLCAGAVGRVDPRLTELGSWPVEALKAFVIPPPMLAAPWQELAAKEAAAALPPRVSATAAAASPTPEATRAPTQRPTTRSTIAAQSSTC